MSFLSAHHLRSSLYGSSMTVMSLAAAFPRVAGGLSFDRLPRKGVVVAVFALEDWRGWVGDAFDIIDTRERERVQRQRQERHRDSLALAYALHRLVLAQALGMSPERVPLTRDARGRPLLVGMAVDTSLSHAEGYAAVAVGMCGPVGVDIEPSHRAGGMPDIAERICHGDEYRRIAGYDDAAQGAALLDLWVRKEAFLKAAGVGLEREMDTFALPEGRSHALHAGDAARSIVDLLDLGPAVVCAVARAPDSACAADWLHPVCVGEPQ